MKVTKLGHCCLLIEEEGVRILTDPGSYSTRQNEVKNIDIVLITHEHADHLHIDSLRTVIANAGQKGLLIITNKGVAKILDKEGISYELIEHGQKMEFKGILIEGFGTKHADIHASISPVDNTGYFIHNRLFYPGDAFTHPGKPVDILALPVAGPWLKISDALAYAEEIKPKTAFPVHDGMLHHDRLGPVHRLPTSVLAERGIKFIILEEGKETEL